MKTEATAVETTTYYKLVLYPSTRSGLYNSFQFGKSGAGKKTYSWLSYTGDDQGLSFSNRGREDESLAIKILIENKDKNLLLRNVLENMLYGQFERVMVVKYTAEPVKLENAAKLLVA